MCVKVVKEAVLRVRGKPAFLAQKELGLCLVLSELCLKRAREPAKHEQAGQSIFCVLMKNALLDGYIFTCRWLFVPSA